MTEPGRVSSPWTRVYVNINEEGEVYDSHYTLQGALMVQDEFPNDTIEVRVTGPRQGASMSFHYVLKDNLTDREMLEALGQIRNLLDGVRALGSPSAAEAEEYQSTFETGQACYESILEQCRNRNLHVEAWEGDNWFFMEGKWETL